MEAMLPRIRLTSLRAKIILWSFVPTAFVLATIALIGIYSYAQVIESQTIANSREVARLAAARIEAQFAQYENQLALLARTTEMLAGNPKTRQEALDQARERLMVFDGGVVVLDIRGQVVAASPELADYVGKYWSGQPFFKKMIFSLQSDFSQVTFSEEKEERFAIVAVPMIGGYGDFTGVLVGTFHVDPDAPSPAYGSAIRIQITQEETAYLVDPGGRVLYDTHEAEIGRDFSGREAVKMVNTGKVDALLTRDESGQSILASFAPIPRTSWGLVLEKNWAALLEPNFYYLRILLGLLVFGLLLPALVVAFGIRRILEPIRLLTEAARQVADGKLDQEIWVKSGDELEDLAQQFNVMSHSLVQTVSTLKKTNRSLQALIECSQILVRESDEVALLDQICQVFVDVGGYRMAWVGFPQQDEAKSILPMAKAGFDEGYLADINVSWADNERGQTTAGTSIRTRRPVIIGDISNDPRFAPWREQAAQRGYRSVISLPLIHQEDLFGIIVIYSTQVDAFDATEVSLLSELSSDLAYGIASLRTQAERERTGVELARYRDHLEELVEARTAELERLNKDLIVAKEAAEAADHIKSAFLATMSHELRTPLNSIIGFTGIILKGLAGPLNPEQEKQLGFVQSSARHLLELINDILDISKIEVGQLTLFSEKFELTPSLEKVIQLITPIATEKHLQVRALIDPGIGAVFNDRRRLEQILINLLNNAIKFTDQGEIELICQAKEDQIILSIHDSGIGIKPEQVEKIFKPFGQLDTSLSRKNEGSGLGLSISKKLVEMMGGSLTLKSEWGVGSTFTITLPRQVEKSK
jgi:signal transduction histidine kinase